MPSISGRIATDPYVTDLTSDSGHALLSDEPLAQGGQNMGLTPAELLASSLSACTCITLRMYADRKGWPLEQALTTVGFERGPDHVVHRLTRRVQLLGNLSDQQRQRLLQVANACPVHKALAGGIEIDTTLT
ncbi:OsmC family protein [Hymenobacter latericus]|uniref:OsmC family protein n=1 Tax=Hymenobacter sp. YIM 151858-1 TaxID=2987688 RepID=UPI002226FAA2|nr:OsmC family protein [Hymenobacter sp. YIM 151858-1]UYZ57655.1 OsmC family protein [Hymenobacter sp. YIM 151858-1]